MDWQAPGAAEQAAGCATTACMWQHEQGLPSPHLPGGAPPAAPAACKAVWSTSTSAMPWPAPPALRLNTPANCSSSQLQRRQRGAPGRRRRRRSCDAPPARAPQAAQAWHIAGGESVAAAGGRLQRQERRPGLAGRATHLRCRALDSAVLAILAAAIVSICRVQGERCSPRTPPLQRGRPPGQLAGVAFRDPPCIVASALAGSPGRPGQPQRSVNRVPPSETSCRPGAGPAPPQASLQAARGCRTAARKLQLSPTLPPLPLPPPPLPPTAAALEQAVHRLRLRACAIHCAPTCLLWSAAPSELP